MNVVEDVTTVDKKEEIKKIGKLVDELGLAGANVPKKVIKKIGKIVPDDSKKKSAEFRGQSAESNKKTASNTKVQDSGERNAFGGNQQTKIYDFKKPFHEQIDDYKKGVFPKSDSLILGPTPDVFKKIGFNSLPMTMTQKHVDYVVNGTKNADHQIGEIVLKYLPTAMKNPVAIITSATANSTSLVTIISITHNGHQIIAPVYIDGTGKQNGIVIDSNAITTAHSRKNAISTLLADALNDESNGKIGIYYWDKKRALALLSGEKVTMPNNLNTLSDGSIHSILEKDSPVKPKLKNITESQQFKRRSAKKQYKDSTYIPVRINTPRILIDVAGSYGAKIENLPVVMQVEKIRQAMATKEQWRSENKTSRAHELSSDEIISIIKAMNTPQYIIYQTDNDRYVEIVKYESSKGTEAVAVIEIGEHKNPEYLNGYKGGEYQVLITTFNPDENTIDSILNKKSNRILYPKKKKGSSQRGSGNNVPSHLNDSPFAISIPQNSQNDNSFSKKSEKTFDSGERSALADGKRVTATEVAAVKSTSAFHFCECSKNGTTRGKKYTWRIYKC